MTKQNIIQVTGSADYLSAENGDRRFWPVNLEADKNQGNREQRRQAAREARRTPPAPRRYVPITNAMEYVTLRATALTQAERVAMLQPARDGFKALREGVATYLQWAHVAGAVAVALAIEEQGKIHGLKEHLQAADQALAAVCKRVQDGVSGSSWGRCTTLYFDEIAALREALHLHDFQLKRLAVSELRAAIEKARLDVRALGGQEITPTAESQPEHIQEKLL